MPVSEDWENYALPEGRRLVRDATYGFLQVMPRPTADEMTAFYANAYMNPCLVHDPDGRADLVCDLVPTPGCVLDIGCGRGEMLDAFARRGWDVLGIEPSREYSEVARAKGIQVLQELLLPRRVAELGTFDAVLLVHVLEHLPDPAGMLAMVRRLLKRGGVFYCEVPNDFNRLQQVAVKTHNLPPWWIAVPDHLNYFTIDSLAAFIAGHGLEVVRKTTDFPVELFLLWGDIYVGNPEAGRAMHQRRCRFEQAMRAAGEGELLKQLYERLAALGLGREAIVCAREP